MMDLMIPQDGHLLVNALLLLKPGLGLLSLLLPVSDVDGLLYGEELFKLRGVARVEAVVNANDGQGG